MSFDFARFCTDYDIPTAPAGHKHSTKGWINVPCPFCAGHDGWHLGFELQGGFFRCWRCRNKRPYEVICALIGCDMVQAAGVWAQYSGRPPRPVIRPKRKQAVEVKMPVGCTRMGPAHRTYLHHRNFNYLDLEEEWGLKGTGPVGPYKFRIIAPIYYQGKLVSYQGRDITDRAENKYKACPAELEARPHQDCLYGLDKVRGGCIVIVEGIADVWRLGIGAVATFGIDFTQAQVLLASKFLKRYFLYDNEDAAQERAHEFAACLSALGGESYILNLDVGDPAEMTQRAADKLMKGIIGRAA